MVEGKFKRGEPLLFGKAAIPVKYCKMQGPMRPTYVVVEFPDGERRTVDRRDLNRPTSKLH